MVRSILFRAHSACSAPRLIGVRGDIDATRIAAPTLAFSQTHKIGMLVARLVGMALAGAAWLGPRNRKSLDLVRTAIDRRLVGNRRLCPSKTGAASQRGIGGSEPQDRQTVSARRAGRPAAKTKPQKSVSEGDEKLHRAGSRSARSARTREVGARQGQSRMDDSAHRLIEQLGPDRPSRRRFGSRDMARGAIACATKAKALRRTGERDGDHLSAASRRGFRIGTRSMTLRFVVLAGGRIRSNWRLAGQAMKVRLRSIILSTECCGRPTITGNGSRPAYMAGRTTCGRTKIRVAVLFSCVVVPGFDFRRLSTLAPPGLGTGRLIRLRAALGCVAAFYALAGMNPSCSGPIRFSRSIRRFVRHGRRWCCGRG